MKIKNSVLQVAQPHATTNKQTTAFCAKLGILDPMALLIGREGGLPTKTQF